MLPRNSYFAFLSLALVSIWMIGCGSGYRIRISGTLPSSGTVNVAYGPATLTASGGTAPYTWTVSGLPTGVTVQGSLTAASITISGTPTAAGTFMASVMITDSKSRTVMYSVTITIAAGGSGPSVTTTSLPNGTVGSAYSASLAATGGTTPYTWTEKSGGNLPGGLMLTGNNGMITGTPTASGTFGPYVFTVTDANNKTADSPSLMITIAAAASGPTVTTTSLPNGTVGTAYTVTLAATGGTTPYTWTEKSGGNLPGGLMLTGSTGAIVGTPTASGAFGPYVFTVTDANSKTADSPSLMITIAAATPSIAATSGSGQSAAINTAFAASLVATVTTGGTDDSGVVVTFTAPAETGASGKFADGTNTTMVTTGANGQATATFTANGTAGSYSVTATAPGAATPANFTLTNTAATVTENFTFYLSGTEQINSGPNFYALAGAVTINTTTGAVVPNAQGVAGEQDYNDAFGITSPQPQGDLITGGQLTVDSTTGQGTLTLVTNNLLVGGVGTKAGTETMGVQFVNAKHALIIQFDGSATSSGSLDLQTLPSPLSPPSGVFSFTFSGLDTNYNEVVAGGVLSMSGNSLSGTYDVNNFGVVLKGNSIPAGAMISTPDTFGRGAITGAGILEPVNYYTVGPEAIRLIDVDMTDLGVGSAFGQGTSAGSFGNASLKTSVLALASNNGFVIRYAAVGVISTSNTSSPTANFSGVGDINELDNGIVVSASPVSGTYSIGMNGYGSLTITNAGLGNVKSLGVYAVDPTLNINDPNNTANGLGGALVVDLDAFAGFTGQANDAVGTGALVPQKDPSTASFAGNYAFGAADFVGGEAELEYDFVGQGSVTGGVLSGTGLVSDPSFALTSKATDSDVLFSGTVVPDGKGIGRYTMATPNELVLTINGIAFDFTTVIYQASGEQLVWLDENVDGSGSPTNLFNGTLQQQLTATPFPGGTGRRAGVASTH